MVSTSTLPVMRPLHGTLAPLFLYALASFLSAALLFLIEPLFGKMVLPLLGGSPAVWNTCMLFFQAVLLAGYGYAHLSTRWIPPRWQAAFHLLLALPTFLVLPIVIAGHRPPPTDANPIPWLLGVLATSVGLPFFMVSTSGPLLQKWFAASDHPASADPYFLYAAGNLGSILALVSYPAVAEPLLALPAQARLWTAGYGILAISIAACSWSVVRGKRQKCVENTSWKQLPRGKLSEKGPDIFLRCRWVVLAFVPSSLMLSVTTYLTTDIAAVPLLWIIPLALYLLSFVLVFARKPLVPWVMAIRVLPMAMVILAVALLAEATEPIWLLLPLHLTAFFLTALVCHGELARRRPGVEHLTEYYLWLGLGGVLGGLFNVIVAPLIFPTIIEYPLVLVLACFLRPSLRKAQAPLREKSPAKDDPYGPEAPARWSIFRSLKRQPYGLKTDAAFAVGVALTAIALGYFIPVLGVAWRPLRLGLLFGLPAALCYTAAARPIRFGLGLGALLVAGAFHHGDYGSTLLCQRSFFGIHRVTIDPSGKQHLLVHGSTVHGREDWTEERPREPLTYYHRSGPIGRLFKSFQAEPEKRRRIAVVGLGAGSLAAYGQRGQEFTFYEIDPTVEQIARDERYFTFLHDCRARLRIIRGDARLKLQDDERFYDLLVIDAFTSDAIPLHLLTREALAIYLRRLAPGGLLAFNVSNRYLDLQPVLGDLAGDTGLRAWAGNELAMTQAERQEGKSPSQWVLMARSKSDLGLLVRSARWEPLAPRPGVRVWSDDFSNLFSAFRWIE
jgi:SAM-dependent methyltransferase